MKLIGWYLKYVKVNCIKLDKIKIAFEWYTTVEELFLELLGLSDI